MSEQAASRGKRLDEAVAETHARLQKNRRASSEAAFRARVEERLRGLEADVGDVKSRLNGLYLVIASTVLAQVLLKVAA